MVKTWSADNPKAALMERKRALIVDASLKAFLNAGYAEASVNQIAADAGVSIKTLYRHFESKDDLFSAVMQAACGQSRRPGMAEKEPDPDWYALAPAEALPVVGGEYLRHVLSRDQLALYRVVARDAHRFPEIARLYQEQTNARRDALFATYLGLWADREGWRIRDKNAAAQTFAALLKVGVFENGLFGLSALTEAELAQRAQDASHHMMLLLHSARF